MRHIIAASVLATGCLMTTTSVVRENVRAEDVTKTLTPWGYETAVSVKAAGDTSRLELIVTRHHTCVTMHVITYRSRAQASETWAGHTVVHGLMIAGAAAAVGALANHYLNHGSYADSYGPGAPESARSGWGATSTTGFLLVGGAAVLGISAAVAIPEDLRITDVATDLGEKSESKPSRETPCQQERASNTHVNVFGTEGTTDDRGVLSIAISNDNILKSADTDALLIESQPVKSQDLANLYQHLKTEANAKVSAREGARLDEEEVGNGKCSQVRTDATASVPGAVSDYLKTASGPSLGTLGLVTSSLAVATPRGVKVDFGTLAPGQYHVFAYGFSKSWLEVATTSGNVANQDSILQSKLVTLTSLKWNSRTATLNSGESLSTKVVGFGCVLVLLIKQS